MAQATEYLHLALLIVSVALLCEVAVVIGIAVRAAVDVASAWSDRARAEASQYRIEAPQPDLHTYLEALAADEEEA